VHDFWGDTRSLVTCAAVLAGAILVALLAHYILYSLVERFARRKSGSDIFFVKRSKAPTRTIFPLLALAIAMPFAPLPQHLKDILQHILGIGVIGAIGWGVIIIVQVFADVVYARYTIDVDDNLIARRIRTQTQVMQRIVVVVVSVVTLAIMLMTFPEVRHIGTSLLASAGLAGLVVGMAAKSTLTNVIAGVQVALSQPIRIDDAVVVEGEWGWIEEIDASYVVVRIWDLRRLIVPLSYFIEKPFQNWTRTRAELLGTVMIYTDFTAPVEDIRQELQRLLKATNLWDGKTWALQVTDMSYQSMQLRALMSAKNGPTAFDLRCYVRENLIKYLQEKYPQSLPQGRNRNIPENGMALHDADSHDGGLATTKKFVGNNVTAGNNEPGNSHG
jgi:small-conductance mechanosensitive channel